MPPKNIQVVVRCRPMNTLERNKGAMSSVDCTADRVTIKERNAPTAATKTFTFDRVFGPLSKQNELYRAIVKPVVEEVLEGYNCTVFAYGQTGTGKTFTMVGERSDELRYTWEDDPLAGIIPRSLSHLFDRLETNGCEFSMRVSFLELYNEELFDLLAAGEENNRLRIFEDASRKGSVVVQGLEEVAVSNKDAVYEIIQRGMQRRATASTLLNAQSSRSHSVFTVTLHMRENSVDGEEMLKIGKLNLVDLAGSENIGRSGALEKRAREAGSINQSLLTLGRVITALVERTPHIPYRESKLTRILQDSLGGRTKTSIIATISPGSVNLEETISTLDYAHRAKNIQNRPEVNQKLCKKALLKEYSDEVERLRRDLLATREKNGCFMDFANYQRMQTTMQQQRDRITEQETALTAQRQELEKLSDILQLTEEEMETLRGINSDLEADLMKTRRQAAAIQQRLVDTEIARREQEDLKEAHMETEVQLTDEATRLMVAADASVGDVAALHKKVDRMKTSESGTRGVADRLAESVSHRCGSARHRLDGMSDDLTRAGDVATSELSQLSEEVLSRSAEVDAVVRSHVTRLDKAVGDVRSMVVQHAQEQRQRAECTSCRLQELRERLTSQTGAVRSAVENQVFAGLRDLSSRLSDDLDTVEETARRQHTQSAAETIDIEVQHSSLLKDVTSLVTKLDQKQMKRYEELKLQFEDAEAERQADTREVTALLNRISSNFEANISKHKAKDQQAAACSQSSISAAKESCHSLTEELSASESALVTKIRESQGVMELDIGGIEAEISSWKEKVEEREQQLRGQIDERLGILGGEIGKEAKQKCDETAKGAKDSVLQMKNLLEENMATAQQMMQKLCVEMDDLEERVVHVLTAEMPLCPTTGTTPARREYQYPRQLTRTSPISRLARFRDRLDRAEVEAVCRIEEETEEDGKRRHSSGIGSVCTQSSSRPDSPEIENEIPKVAHMEPVPITKTVMAATATTKTATATNATATATAKAVTKKSKRPFQNRN